MRDSDALPASRPDSEVCRAGAARVRVPDTQPPGRLAQSSRFSVASAGPSWLSPGPARPGLRGTGSTRLPRARPSTGPARPGPAGLRVGLEANQGGQPPAALSPPLPSRPCRLSVLRTLTSAAAGAAALTERVRQRRPSALLVRAVPAAFRWGRRAWHGQGPPYRLHISRFLSRAPPPPECMKRGGCWRPLPFPLLLSSSVLAPGPPPIPRNPPLARALSPLLSGLSPSPLSPLPPSSLLPPHPPPPSHQVLLHVAPDALADGRRDAGGGGGGVERTGAAGRGPGRGRQGVAAEPRPGREGNDSMIIARPGRLECPGQCRR